MKFEDLLILEKDYLDAKNEYVNSYRTEYGNLQNVFNAGNYEANAQLCGMIRRSFARLEDFITGMDDCCSVSSDSTFGFSYHKSNAENEIDILHRLL